MEITAVQQQFFVIPIGLYIFLTLPLGLHNLKNIYYLAIYKCLLTPGITQWFLNGVACSLAVTEESRSVANIFIFLTLTHSFIHFPFAPVIFLFNLQSKSLGTTAMGGSYSMVRGKFY